MRSGSHSYTPELPRRQTLMSSVWNVGYLITKNLISENSSCTSALAPPTTGQSLRHSAACILQVKLRYAFAMLTTSH